MQQRQAHSTESKSFWQRPCSEPQRSQAKASDNHACDLIHAAGYREQSNQKGRHLWEGTAKAVEALEFDAVERFWLFSRAESLLPASPPLMGWSPTALPAMRNLWCCWVNLLAVWIMMSHLHMTLP